MIDRLELEIYKRYAAKLEKQLKGYTNDPLFIERWLRVIWLDCVEQVLGERSQNEKEDTTQHGES